ncbi:kinase-like domain-containing protein [Mycena galopus ATCC 62051]|nr:kinase-like domain-containing protein [Mycena galopus ATCC 62051]
MRLCPHVSGANLLALIEDFLDDVSLEIEKSSPGGEKDALQSVFNAYFDDTTPECSDGTPEFTDGSHDEDDTDELRSIFDAYFDGFVDRRPPVAVGELEENLNINDALRALIDAYFFQPSIRTHDFVLQSATLLKSYPHLVRKLDTFLHAAAVEEKLQVIPHPAGARLAGVELIVLSGPSGGMIYELSNSTSTQPQWSRVASTAALRTILRQNSIHFDLTKATPSASWACALTELLQDEIRYSADTMYKTMCMRHLQRLTRKFGILPASFFVHNVYRDGLHAIAGGGFADVYKGTLNGSPVCLKVLRFFTQASEMRDKLLRNCCREALVWKQLDHPNVLPFLGVSVELFAPSFCLVSPWMANGNLIEYLRAHPEFDRFNAISEIAAAIQYLHEYTPSIVHADIRGNNVLILDDLRCCLADFGLSCVAESFSVSSTSGNNKGSVRWMAPEYLTPSARVNELKRTTRDIYAFGCTAYEVYTGSVPFAEYHLDWPVIQDVLARRRPLRISSVFPDHIWNLIEGCWSHEPHDRPSAEMVVRSLKDHTACIKPKAGTYLWDHLLDPSLTRKVDSSSSRDSGVSSFYPTKPLVNSSPDVGHSWNDDDSPKVTPHLWNHPADPSLTRKVDSSSSRDSGVSSFYPTKPLVNSSPDVGHSWNDDDSPKVTPYLWNHPADPSLTRKVDSSSSRDFGVSSFYPTQKPPANSSPDVGDSWNDDEVSSEALPLSAPEAVSQLQSPVDSGNRSPRRFAFNAMKFNWFKNKTEPDTEERNTELIRMITYLVSTACKDWDMVLKLCEHVDFNGLNAKTAVAALEFEFRRGDPFTSTSTAKLWALILHNSSESFKYHCMASGKFLNTLKDILMSQRTPRALRELLSKVLSDVSYTTNIGSSA